MALKHRKATLTLLTLVLALASLSFKCGGGGDADPRQRYAKAADDIAGGISAMIDAKRSLARRGLITQDEERRLTQSLTVTNEAVIAFNNRVQVTATLNASNRAEMLTLFSNVTSATNNLNNDGVMNISNIAARQQLLRIVNTINASINILTQLAAGCHEVPPNCYQCDNGQTSCPP